MHRCWDVRRAVSADSASLRRLAVLILALAAPAAATPGRAPAAEPVPETPAAQSVGPVSVTATRGERDVLEVAGHVTVLDRERIERSGARDVVDLLRREAGLFVTNSTGTLAGVSVEARGFNNGGALGSSLLVLVDGRRANEADTGNLDWTLFSLDEIERIEVLRGPASAVYGDNAVGGVVQILTRPAPGPLRATLHGSGGSYDTGQGSLLARGSLSEALSGSLFVGGASSDGYRQHSDLDAVNLNAELALDASEALSLGVGGSYHDDEREFPGSLTLAETESLGRRAADPATQGNGDRVDVYGVHAWLESEPARDVSLSLRPWYRERNDHFVISSLGFGTSRTRADKESTGTSVELRVDRPLGRMASRLLLGGELLHESVDREIDFGSGLSLSDNRRLVLSLFVQEELEPAEGWLLGAGLRFDHADYRIRTDAGTGPSTIRPEFDLLSPRISASYRLWAPVSVYASGGRGFRLPNFDEDAPFFGPAPDLDPQSSWSAETGVKAESERVSGTLALYWMRVHDEITFNPSTFSNENFDRVRHRGLELSLRARPCEWLELHGSYTLDDVEIRKYVDPSFEGRRMPITPLHHGAAGVLFLLPFGLEAGLDSRLVGKRFLSNDFANALLELEGYYALDTHVTLRRVLGPHLEGSLGLAVLNFTNERYVDFGAVFSPMTPFETFGFSPAPERSYLARFALTVKR
jgi:iron complex outermembrane receptor protein